MDIKRIVLQPFGTNCYIVSDAGETAIIDPGNDAKRIMENVPDGSKVKYIILTHGHFDHIMAASEIKKKVGCRIFIHAGDKDMLSDGKLSLAERFGVTHIKADYDECISDGDTLPLGTHEFKVICTPGHTKGCICLLCGDLMFSGDTLFRETIGNFQRENKAEMQASVKKLMQLDDKINVYPGHGDATTIGYEKKHNPYADFSWEWE